MVSVSVIILQLITAFLLVVDGYIIDRWSTLEDPARLYPLSDSEYIRYPVRRSVDTEEASMDRTFSQGYAKKSQNLSYKALKKFSGSGSRNCFFTPIQCMIQHDMSKYKKLVDGSKVIQN
ncbi:unnamed protein product [Bursaphelenchus xylophilus]|uniref:(pine wood nematode) hypothetical protein n=1 Tax=Bursaphelenchus xylophilus TaxID=6326 RepID=A0A1I7SWJ7_BURXY|nr:unnamed protein product [Bursaphelenchus xylophilus]CAG9099522.1 unnamed protein product [Bursaphelenchus xylophilus]